MRARGCFRRWHSRGARAQRSSSENRCSDAGAAATGAVYAAAEQTADFGGLPSSFGFAVSQVSAVYGPGHEATGTFDA